MRVNEHVSAHSSFSLVRSRLAGPGRLGRKRLGSYHSTLFELFSRDTVGCKVKPVCRMVSGGGIRCGIPMAGWSLQWRKAIREIRHPLIQAPKPATHVRSRPQQDPALCLSCPFRSPVHPPKGCSGKPQRSSYRVNQVTRFLP